MEKNKKGDPHPLASSDQEDAQLVKQAIKDDQGLLEVAQDIQVTVKDGIVILDGKVSSTQQADLATNTALAVAVDDKVKNHIEIKHPNAQ